MFSDIVLEDGKKADLYAGYLAHRLSFKGGNKQDLGVIKVEQIMLCTFWNLCLSDHVLTEAEFERIMNCAKNSELERVNPPQGPTVVRI
jgi:glucose-6-phosphate dehydrogenase assembly protein OpcA